MHTFTFLKYAKKQFIVLLAILLVFALRSDAQRATVALPIGIGSPCGVGGNSQDSVKYFDYNSNTKDLTHRNICQPILESPGFSDIFASITYNPYDTYIYFTQIAKAKGVWNSYTYRWLPTSCPNTGTPLPVFQTFNNQFVAGVEFDPATGLAYQMNFIDAGGGKYSMQLQEVNFATGALGALKNIDFGSRYIYAQNGDLVMTPGGQMLAIFDNKYFTVNWKDYNTATPLVATYIDTVIVPKGTNLVGLAYSDGKLVASIYGGSCSSTYKEIDILTGTQSPISYNAGPKLFNSTDMTDISSGVGAAKKLVSLTENPVGSKTYDVVYEVFIKNYGGTPVTNLQAYDSLIKINGLGNLISGSITSYTGPSGITVNPAYNGKTDFALFNPGSTFSNIPGQNTLKLQITCKIANIQPGIVYNNQAIVTGVGMFGDKLFDLSTNGSNPDLNLNDKPDDVGENQPTPFLVTVAALSPPCASLTNVLYSQNFGSGTGLSTVIPAPVTATGVLFPISNTLYTGSTTKPIPIETYTITNDPNNANNPEFLSFTDHTGGSNGRMLIVNADAKDNIMYQGGFQTALCANQQYSISFYAAFIGNTTYQTKCNAFGGFQYPKIKIRIRDGVSGLIITELSTTSIVSTSWQQFGLKFLSPTSYDNLIFELINDAPGGCGNDVAIDDIQFGTCDPLPSVNIGAVSAGCLGSSTTFISSLNDPGALPGAKEYQWQVSVLSTGPFINISGATTANYTIPSIAAIDTGKYYRVIIAAAGNIGNASCQYISPALKLTGKVPSVAATTATKNKNNICPGIVVTLGITGGSLGANASWKWYTGSCGGTLVGTGATLSVTPSVTTTYYVRAEGDCNTTSCQQVTVFISCDIDKDKDGIPDYVESNMPVALQDANSNGIINALDPTYPGFVDNTNDFINDNFQADGDSDNDGIPNYLDTNFPGRIDTNGDNVDDRFDTDKDGIINMLDRDSDNDGIPDVVECYGVDANGDGKIDNYTDTDNDGLSQNVDANSTGVPGSGLGLGIPDLDGDGIPNYIDLDSDNDGIPDVVEVQGPYTSNTGRISGFTDTDGDGFSDNVDGDVGNDGIAENTLNALLRTGADTSPADGRADSYPYKNMDQDSRANPYDCDSDGDGIVDVIESGLPDTNFDGWIDGTIGVDGWSNTVRAMASLNLTNTDGRGKPNYLDIDSDDDGIPDNVEGMSTYNYKLPSFLDTDKDGLDDRYDTRNGFGGPGIFAYDKDGDEIPDYIDLDTDSDGIPDIIEGNDFNLNGLADDDVALTYLDDDGDGLDNKFDAINSLSDIRGTSGRMGNSGSFTGDATPGSRSPVQQTPPSAPDRDWRSVGLVLNVKKFNLDGTRQGNRSLLKWAIITKENIDHFEIERSVSNGIFITVAAIHPEVYLNEEQVFDFTDNIEGIDASDIVYRVKLVSKTSGSKYTNSIVVHPGQIRHALRIAPNPANEYINISFYADKDTTIDIRLIDNSGKTVLMQKQAIVKGSNTVKLINLSKYPEGVYSIQTVLNGQLTTEKILLLTNK